MNQLEEELTGSDTLSKRYFRIRVHSCRSRIRGNDSIYRIYDKSGMLLCKSFFLLYDQIVQSKDGEYGNENLNGEESLNFLFDKPRLLFN